MRLGVFAIVMALLLGAAGSAGAPAFAQSQSQTPAQTSHLAALLEAELAQFPAKAGVYVKNLATGEEASVRGNEHFESASTIKLATLVLAFRMADAHQIDLNERITLQPSDMRGGSGIFRYKGPGLNPSVRDLLTEMVITSDNTATDLMMAKVGGVERIVEFLRGAGFTAIRPNYTTNDYFRGIYEAIDPKYKALSPEDVFALCCSKTTLPNFPPLSPARAALVKEVEAAQGARSMTAILAHRSDSEQNWFGIATPIEIGRILEGIQQNTIASPESCEEMRRMLRNTVSSGTAVASAIELYLNVPVGHKTGDTGGVTNDVGIIYAHSGPIVMTSYNMNIVGPTEAISERVGRVAHMVVEYFDGRP